MDNIKLRKVHELDDNTLPRGVYALLLGDQVFFVRRLAGRFIPLPENEQKELRERHVI